MGAGSWDSSAYRAYSSTVAGASLRDVFKTDSATYHAKTGSKDSLNPKGIKVRESRDSAINPQSTAIIVGLDVTGSMGMLAEHMAKEGLGIVFDEILKRKPVTDPHLMFMAIGDGHFGDIAPLQVSQFEADERIIKQLSDIYVEHGGGNNNFESYNLPWYFAAMHTSIDCIEKRGKRGYLFTVGDEEAPENLPRYVIEKYIGDTPERDLPNSELLALVQRMYNVFHVVVAEGHHASRYPDRVRRSWTHTLGQNMIWLDDHRKLSEVIVSAIQVAEGIDKDEVVKSWSGDTSLVVASAIKNLPGRAGNSGEGVTRL